MAHVKICVFLISVSRDALQPAERYGALLLYLSPMQVSLMCHYTVQLALLVSIELGYVSHRSIRNPKHV